MADQGMDPSLLQDFLTESGELIEQLGADLVTLETVAGQPQEAELLNQIFRALHTIKGAASFLGLTNITHFAHAAEDALNKLRKGEVRVSATVMDALLRSADVVREMIAQLGAGEPVSEGPADLIAQLHAIAAGEVEGTAPADKPASTPAAPSVATAAPEQAGEQPLNLSPQKMDLLEFMVADLKQQSQNLATALAQCRAAQGRSEAIGTVLEVAGELQKTAEFFELRDLTTLINVLIHAAPQLAGLHGEATDHVLACLNDIRAEIDRQGAALERKMQLTLPVEALRQRLETLLAQTAAEASVETAAAPIVPADQVPTSVANPAVSTASEAAPASAKTATSAPASGGGAEHKPNLTEQTIRVEVNRLETLLNLVGQMVLTKNRILGMAKKLRDYGLPHDVSENVAGVSNELDRLTSELQVGVMRTRMQPLAKLFERYPRVIRDLSRMLDKKIALDIVGKETEVDKSVLELLADPLVHILRNAADHGIETPAVRLQAGKPEQGTIRLIAEHAGSHVRVAIVDDGKGLDRDVLAKKAVEKGLVTAEQVAQMSDSEVFRFIFAAGFSTAERVTDLSGRGVGMDVVRTNIAKLNGQVNIDSTKGRGTTIEILIPLTVAIMPAMVVGVGASLYCIPLQSIVEIVKPEDTAIYTIRGHPVMRLRDAVLPLVDMRQRLGEPGQDRRSPFAVVVAVGGQSAGLLVDKLIGQQEIVIKPLDDKYANGGPFSGATIREDGDVSLILDVIQLIRQAQTQERAAA